MSDDVTSATAQVYDALSSSYNQIVPFFTYFGERLVVTAGIGEGDHVLDVATGQGACLIPAAAAVGPGGAVIGIDISEQMLDVLAQSIEGAGLRHVRVQMMDAERLTFDDGSLDLVTALRGLPLPGPRARPRRVRSGLEARRNGRIQYLRQ